MYTLTKNITFMTKEEAEKKTQEINELKDHEMYDTQEKSWVLVLKAESIKGRINSKIHYVRIELKPLDDDDVTITVAYDYFREHIKVNKLEKDQMI